MCIYRVNLLKLKETVEWIYSSSYYNSDGGLKMMNITHKNQNSTNFIPLKTNCISSNPTEPYFILANEEGIYSGLGPNSNQQSWISY